MMPRGVVALLLLACPGCATYPVGSFTAASSQALPGRFAVLDEAARGQACGMERRFQRAVADAIQGTPGANALLDASFRFERLCVSVSGRAVRATVLPPEAEASEAPGP
jgi:hypothetical protein